MYQSHGRRVAITMSGGIDSTVLAYAFCENDGKWNFLSPTPFPPGQKTEVHLIHAAIGGAANSKATEPLLMENYQDLVDRYHEKFIFRPYAFNVTLPPWREDALMIPGYQPQRHGDNPNEKTFTELGPDVHIDGRNAIFMLWILSYCSKLGVDTLLTGHQLEVYEWDELDCYRARTEDVGPAFIERLNLLTEVGFKRRVRVVAPFLDMRLSKYNIVKLGRDLGIDLEKKTYSCYFYPPCGKCGNCIVRQKALSVIAPKEGFRV
jgi:7-cyano-7-deazaguanine synthase in queuosine biosynthesis